MEFFAFVGSGDTISDNLFLGTFLLMLYIIFVIPLISVVLIVIFRKKIMRNLIKSTLLIAAITLFVLGWTMLGLSDDYLAVLLNFIFAPSLIAGSLYWYGKLDKNDKHYKLKAALLVGNAILLLLTIISNFLA